MQSLPKIQPNLIAILTEFRDLYGYDPLSPEVLTPDQVDDMMSADERWKKYDEADKSMCCDAGISNQGFCGACGEHA